MDLRDINDQIAEIKRAQNLIKDRVDRMATRDVQNHSSGSWAPTFTGFSADPASPICRYVLIGKMCTCFVYLPNAGTSSSATFAITAPFTAATVAGQFWGSVFWNGVDNGAQLTTPGMVTIASGGTAFYLSKTIAGGGGWTAANGKDASFTITYEIA